MGFDYMTFASYSILLCIILPTIVAKLLFKNEDSFPNDDRDYMSDHYSDDDCSLDADDEYVPDNTILMTILSLMLMMKTCHL